MSRTTTPAGIVTLFPGTELPLPGNSLPYVPENAPPVVVVPASAMLDSIDDAVVHALAYHDPRAYFQALAKQKPDLFFKYVALVVQTKANSSPASRSGTIISPLGRSALDEPPGG